MNISANWIWSDDGDGRGYNLCSIFRRDFRLDVMLKANDKPHFGQDSLFGIPEDIRPYLSENPVTKEYMAEPIREYPPVHYRKVQENG